jgi:hypothetical protein
MKFHAATTMSIEVVASEPGSDRAGLLLLDFEMMYKLVMDRYERLRVK